MHAGSAIQAWSLGLCLMVGLGCFQKDNNSGDTGFENRCDSLDTGNQDTGSADTGGEDTGGEDTGGVDTGGVDTGGEDTGGEDTGIDASDPMPDWSLVDINPNSPTCNQSISPRDYLQKTSGWYFMHAT